MVSFIFVLTRSNSIFVKYFNEGWHSGVPVSIGSTVWDVESSFTR